jgi:hypothetical protein
MTRCEKLIDIMEKEQKLELRSFKRMQGLLEKIWIDFHDQKLLMQFCEIELVKRLERHEEKM